MRKIVSILIAVCLSFCMIGFSAYAEGPSSPTNPEISNNLYTVNVSTGLGKAGSGINYNCDVFGKPNATRIQVFLYLQRFVNGAWTDVDRGYT